VSNNLKLAYDREAAKAALVRAGIAPSTRAETIALEDMARLYQELKNQELKK
jgi:16S rRNA A1518/A1519 N6-dimethyltransferase RsmA/KsgA/DIM1 with predicted DNA glycosylase/AP lyase activity